jgi:hypothetical protein
MTPNDEVNTLACMGLTERFSRAEVYQLAPTEATSEKRELVKAYRRGRTLFRRPLSFSQLELQFDVGGKIKKTSLKDEFTYDDFLALYGEHAQVLFRVDEVGRLTVATNETPLTARPGHKLISIIHAPTETTAN